MDYGSIFTRFYKKATIVAIIIGELTTRNRKTVD
jgi:hypothetical protein